MADLSVTAASVLASSTATKSTGVAGATITAGQALYADATADGVLKLADANASLATSTMVGIALHAALTGQPITYVTADSNFAHGLGSVTAGQVIVLSATAGALAPVADLATGWFPVVAIISTSATHGVLAITRGGVACP
jgi:hypothetical protein